MKLKINELKFNLGMISFLLVFIGIYIFWLGCKPIPPKRALTKAEQAVKIVKGDQNTTLKLNDKCKQVGIMEKLAGGEYDIKIAAHVRGANFAQIIYTTNMTSSYGSYKQSDIKYWSCLEDPF